MNRVHSSPWFNVDNSKYEMCTHLPQLESSISRNNLHFIILFDNSSHSGVATVFTVSDDARRRAKRVRGKWKRNDTLFI